MVAAAYSPQTHYLYILAMDWLDALHDQSRDQCAGSYSPGKHVYECRARWAAAR